MTKLSTRLAAITIKIDPPHLSKEPWSLINSIKQEHWDDFTQDLRDLGAIIVEPCKPTTGCWYVTFSIGEPIDLDKIEQLRHECYILYKSYQEEATE